MLSSRWRVLLVVAVSALPLRLHKGAVVVDFVGDSRVFGVLRVCHLIALPDAIEDRCHVSRVEHLSALSSLITLVPLVECASVVATRVKHLDFLGLDAVVDPFMIDRQLNLCCAGLDDATCDHRLAFGAYGSVLLYAFGCALTVLRCCVLIIVRVIHPTRRRVDHALRGQVLLLLPWDFLRISMALYGLFVP